MEEVHVKGLSELQKFLSELPLKLERNIMRGAMRAGIKEMQPAAKSGVHSVSGELAKGLKVSTRIVRGRQVIGKLRATGPHARIAHLVEFGTKAHFIRAFFNEALRLPGGFATEVFHPGAAPRPFMRPAFDSKAQAAVIAAAEYIKKRLTKEGLEVSDVVIEGDE